MGLLPPSDDQSQDERERAKLRSRRMFETDEDTGLSREEVENLRD